MNNDHVVLLHHLHVLKGGFFKILPLFEEGNENIFKYLISLSVEVNGLQYRVPSNQYHRIGSLLCILESLCDESICADYDLALIKSEVFKCTNLIEKMESDCK